MNHRIDFSWKNQLVFPIIIAASLLNAYLLQQPLLLLVSIYFSFVLCCKKQVVLGLLCIFCSFFLLLRAHTMALPQAPEAEKEVSTKIKIYNDTIKVNGDLVSFEGKIDDYKIDGQYQVENKQEQKSWKRRANWSKEIQVSGTFLPLEGKRNLHGFDAKWFAFSKHKLGTYRIEEIQNKRPLSGISFLRQWRAFCIDWVEANFSSKTATYILSLLFGYRDTSFQEIKEVYSSAGILHLFTISGMHVYLFYGWLFFFLRRTNLTFGEFGLFFFLLIFVSTILFGQTISVWRASLMYILRLFFKEINIKLASLDRFSIVLFLLLLYDPKTLLQFSGILSLWMSWVILLHQSSPKKYGQRLLHSQEISLLAAPLIMYMFFEVPLLAGLLTALFVPLFSRIILPLLVASCFVNLLGFSHNILEIVLEKLIIFFEKTLSFTKSFVLTTGQPPLFLTILALIAGIYIYQNHRKICLLLPSFLLIVFQLFSLETSIAFVDVGQGDSIVIQTPFKQEVYVIDTGGKMNFFQEDWQRRNYRSNAEYTLIPYLKGEGVKKIDGLFITHGDIDHMGDAQEVMEAFNVKSLYLGKGSFQSENIKKLLKNTTKNTVIEEIGSKDHVGKKLKLHILGPEHVGKGENEDSLVIATTIYGTNFVMTGDLGQEGEKKVIKDYPHLQADVLKLGHHGSHTSSAPEFIEQLQPKQGIISCGENNRFGHPHPEVMDTLQDYGVKALRTDKQGMLRYSWSTLTPKMQITTQKQD
ncbi:DNA internalization-related competence protein ComEC/Rec2 [Tetragenococcus halophilus]|uniref:DNA internalization-related competence protein ComEC/Rec2 n=4 Tax=Tetragenococcus halophilus TaxID=51669 RepID=A0AB37D3C0_TETHA|nr:competence protein ComEC [Tetragenococcus halophilus]MCO8284230.1 DNA internalization-related competence protein ComEC/Rec2 [Tetragenococcus halophilus]MCO8285647.1 DNA internalization-related competence protein ComEC/Rec2 [Tetragenococcus halophilus]MCO8292352.1 DNA internalization-related competence protein ComEC/Rec2 [Tetragenococcus halophilus]MCT8309738.1 DNA internalization-related competence protein ComEC/Rec2 [Tetragenococcus halophilus]